MPPKHIKIFIILITKHNEKSDADFKSKMPISNGTQMETGMTSTNPYRRNVDKGMIEEGDIISLNVCYIIIRSL